MASMAGADMADHAAGDRTADTVMEVVDRHWHVHPLVTRPVLGV